MRKLEAVLPPTPADFNTFNRCALSFVNLSDVFLTNDESTGRRPVISRANPPIPVRLHNLLDELAVLDYRLLQIADFKVAS